MKTVKLTKVMEKELTVKSEIQLERVGYLKYTRNYYLLEDDTGSYVTEEPITYVQLQHMDTEGYQIYTLDKEEAANCIGKKTQTRTKRTSAKATPKKEETKEDEPEKETAKDSDDEKIVDKNE